MNILYITDTGDIVGGGEISLLGLLHNIDRKSFNPVVVVPGEGTFSEKVRGLGIDVLVVPFKRIWNPLNLFSSTRAVLMLGKIIRDRAIDIVHSNSTGGVIVLAGIASRLRGVPLVSHIRIFATGIISDVVQSIFSERIVIISKSLKTKFTPYGARSKEVLIYNGIDLESFRAMTQRPAIRKDFGCCDHSPLIGTVGTYKHGKGFRYFLKAAKIVLESVHDARFLISGIGVSGDQAYTEYLEGVIRGLGLADNVKLLRNRQDMPDIISSLDVFAFASSIDPFGRAVVEAMACARPVVAFRSGGIPEIVDDQNTGYLVAPGDYETMANRIIDLIKDPALAKRLGLQGRARAEELFDIKKHAINVEKLYKEIQRARRG